MIDLKLLRSNPNLVRSAIRDKGEYVDLDILLDLDRKYIEVLQQVEELRAERNRLSSSMKGKTDPETISKARALREELAEREQALHAQKTDFFHAFEEGP
ncbi:MAG: hypothetical protein IOC52_01465 [Methylobacterium sp.]|nr:hypothetical protein [Methylobacterium sp.]